jgi:branched-chain amino acid transport system permease protein
MSESRKRLRNAAFTLGAAGLVAVLLAFVDGSGGAKLNDSLALFAIWGIAALSLNLVNGTTGILSLGHHGFMLIGGYVTSLLIVPTDVRDRIAAQARSDMTPFTLSLSIENAFKAVGLDALTTPETLWVRFLAALLVGGLVAMVFGLIVGIPSLRLKGDYLAIVTFGFGEIIRLSASTSLFSPFTNGALGFAGVPNDFGKSVWWTFAILGLTLFVMTKIKFSSFGRALQGIREDEIAAEAMGVNLARSKVLAFAISAFFAGVAGGLWVSYLSAARLDFFLFFLTFFFLVAISVGGTGSYTGVLMGVAVVVFVQQYGDPLEKTYGLPVWFGAIGTLILVAAVGGWLYRRTRRMRPVFHPLVVVLGLIGLATIVFAVVGQNTAALDGTFQAFGMRRILLAVLLIVIMAFRPEGIMSRAEFSWAWLLRERNDQPSDEERAQDAWLSNPDLNREPATSGADPLPASATGEDAPSAVPLLERGHKPDPDEPRYGEGRDWQPADEDDEEDR